MYDSNMHGEKIKILHTIIALWNNKINPKTWIIPSMPLAAFPVINYWISNSFPHFYNYICGTIELAWFGGSLTSEEWRRGRASLFY